MRTTATYEPASGQFVLHTPDQRAAKCWIGPLGGSAGKGCEWEITEESLRSLSPDVTEGVVSDRAAVCRYNGTSAGHVP